MALIIITVVSLIVAVAMSVVAWRLAREERRRSEARVATLASDIRAEGPAPVHVSDRFFSEAQSRTSGSAFRALGIGVLVVGSVIALIVAVNGPRAGSAAAAPTVADKPAAPPLELVGLEHDRDGDRFVVRGVVRYPNQTDLADLTAVVSVVNHQGDITASGEGPVVRGAPASSPASDLESTFVVTVPAVRDVSRYRIGFKSNGRIVAHVDRRERGVIAEAPQGPQQP